MNRVKVLKSNYFRVFMFIAIPIWFPILILIILILATWVCVKGVCETMFQAEEEGKQNE